MRTVILALCVILPLGCGDGAGVVTDACTSFEEPSWLKLDVAIAVSADSQPVVSWTPTSCLMSSIEVYRVSPPDCPAGLPTCVLHYTWRVSTSAATTLPGTGPATIVSPVQYGVAPSGTTVIYGPVALNVGDSIEIWLKRATVDPRWGPQSAGIRMRVGTAASQPQSAGSPGRE